MCFSIGNTQFCKKFKVCKKEKTASTSGQLLGDAERDWRQSSCIPDFHLVFWYGLFWIVCQASSWNIMLSLCWGFFEVISTYTFINFSQHWLTIVNVHFL